MNQIVQIKEWHIYKPGNITNYPSCYSKGIKVL